ncbi:MAG: hypothetical protein EP343_20070 [Deltaproteobacteria bacterium]|nr:MAG: hypothetical protein EP343_20070 [Deltaproteobacteria bacterium]
MFALQVSVRFWKGLFGLLFCVCITGCAWSLPKQKEEARAGVLDLRKSELRSPVVLDGEWLFTWDKLVPPRQASSIPAVPIRVPGVWTNNPLLKKRLPRQGVGTYRLTVLLPRKHPKLMLRVRRVNSAYVLWVNGKRLDSQGKVGRTETSSAMEIHSTLVALPQHNKLNFVVHVGNYRHRVAGIRASWKIGPANLMISQHRTVSFLEGALPAIIFSIGCLFFALGGIRRVESWMWFGAFCLAVSLRTAVGNETIAIQVVAPWLDTVGRLRLEYVCVFWILACAFGVFPSMFPNQAFRKPVFFGFGLAFACSLGAAFLPLHWVLQSLPLFGLLGLLTVFHSLWVVVSAWRANEKIAGVILLGLSVASLAFVHDVLRAFGILYTSLELGGAGFLFLIFVQTYALVLRFAESFDQIKNLSRELEKAHEALKKNHIKLKKTHELTLQELQEARELGSYKLERLLGVGGMGEVWRASHRLLARPAAVKLILPENFKDDDGRRQKRFEREAQATALLRSPHTVELYDFGKSPRGQFYYAMELLDGMDLAAVVSSYGPMPLGRAIHVLRQTCLSLAEAHNAGLIHRDIKPANIFLCRVGEEYDFVKVLDFGLVKTQNVSDMTMEQAPPKIQSPFKDRAVPTSPVDSSDFSADTLDAGPALIDPTTAEMTLLDSHQLTKAGSITGTPAYMSPEQIWTRPLDGRSDLYALACVGYWLLTSKNVFPNADHLSVLSLHMYGRPSDLSESDEQSIPGELSALLLECLEKDRDNRPKDAMELFKRLEALQEQYPWTNSDARAWWEENKPEKVASKKQKPKLS